MKKPLTVLWMIALSLLLPSCAASPTSQAESIDPIPTQEEPMETKKPMKAEGTRQGVFYEIYVGSFADGNGDGKGDLIGLTQKLDYLQELGVTGLWLMPIHPSPSYHKYDVLDYYDIDPDYGTLADFDALIRAADERGMAIILDMVFNCTSNSHPWFKASMKQEEPYTDYYRWITEDTPGYDIESKWQTNDAWHYYRSRYYAGIYARVMPDLNLDSPAVRQELKDIAKFWLDRGAAGFRLDSAPHLYSEAETETGTDYLQKNLDWWSEFYQYCQSVRPDAYLVGEVWDYPPLRAEYMSALGSDFDFTLIYKIKQMLDTGRNIDDTFGEEIEAEAALYAAAASDALNAPFLSNHDTERVFNTLKLDERKMKSAAAIYLTLPGLPFVYYGEELGMQGLKTRDEELRTPFLWGGNDSVQADWIPSTFNSDTLSLAEQREDENSLFHHYKKLIHLRVSHEALYAGRFERLVTGNAAAAAYAMTAERETALIFHNISRQDICLTAEVDGYTLVFAADPDGLKADGGTLSLSAGNSAVFIKELTP